MAKAVFLDRDGVINVDKEYVLKIEDFELIPNTIDALKIMQEGGYILIIITSQSGIGRGYYTEQDFQKLNRHMLGLFSAKGIKISKVYHCPHSPDEGCNCRKPNISIINEAEKEFGIELKKSYVIGDKTSDIEMGKRAGCRTILVQTGKAGRDGKYNVKPDFTAEDLYSGASLIIKMDKNKKQT